MSETAELESPKIVDNGFDGFEIPFEEKQVQQKDQKVEINEKKKEDPKADLVEDGRNFLKEKLGYDDWDSVKSEIETLKTKVQTPAELKFENEISEKIYKALLAGNTDEPYSFLDSQRKFNKLTQGEVTLANAAQIVKAAMLEKYKDRGLNEAEIDYKFNKQFAVPKKPVQSAEELDDEYAEKVAEWQKRVEENEMDLLIEAKTSRAELEKLKAELKFPEIPNINASEEKLTPEQEAKAKKDMDTFIKNADDVISQFEGLSVSYKDKDVDISSSYSLSNEEKNAVKNQIKLLAESNYNSNALFAERWVKEDLTFDFKKMVKDLATLESADNSAQKFVSDAAAKAKLKLIKDKAHIDIAATGGNDLQVEDKTAQQKNEDAIWN